VVHPRAAWDGNRRAQDLLNAEIDRASPPLEVISVALAELASKMHEELLALAAGIGCSDDRDREENVTAARGPRGRHTGCLGAG
jgi:hypothetical protein